MQKYVPVFLLLAIALFIFTPSSAQWVQQCPPIVGSNGFGQCRQGEAVVLSADGKTAVVAASDIDGSNCGIFIYRWQSSQWVQQALINSGMPDGGLSLAVSSDGNTIAMGNVNLNYLVVYVFDNDSWRLQSSIPIYFNYYYYGNANDIGLSYDGNTLLYYSHVWVRSGNSWNLQANLLPVDRPVPTNNECDTANHFSCLSTCALSADGNTAVIGDLYGPDSSTNAWVFIRNGSTWSQQGSRLEGIGSAGTNDNYSGQVSISGDGNTLTIGRGLNSFGNEFWVFTFIGGAWVAQGTYPYSTSTVYGEASFGISLSYADNRLVSTGIFGDAIYYWQRTDTTWQQFGQEYYVSLTNVYETYGFFGGTTPALSMDSSGTRVLLGDWTFMDGIGGAFYFVLSGNSLTQYENELFGTGTSGGSFQGTSCALSRNGNILASGGYFDNGEEGSVWLFQHNGPVWTKLMPKLQIPDNVWQPRFFGYSISLSADGSTLAVGAYNSNEINTYIAPGNVYVYSWNGTGYNLPGDSITTGAALGFGASVSLSDDGNTLLIGTVDSGAYVYTYNGTGWAQQALLYQPGTGMGNPVTLSGDGNTAVVCGGDTATGKGSMYVYYHTGNNWVLQAAAMHPHSLILRRYLSYFPRHFAKWGCYCHRL